MLIIYKHFNKFAIIEVWLYRTLDRLRAVFPCCATVILSFLSICLSVCQWWSGLNPDGTVDPSILCKSWHHAHRLRKWKLGEAPETVSLDLNGCPVCWGRMHDADVSASLRLKLTYDGLAH